MKKAALLLALAAGGLGSPARAAADRPLQSTVVPLAAAPAGDEVVFVVAGDNRPTQKGAPPPGILRSIFREIGLIRPDFVLWTGDTIYGYGDTPGELAGEYDGFLRLAAEGRSPLFNSPGNHEIHRLEDQPCGRQASEEEFERRFGRLYGSFDYAGAHFIALDTEVPCEEDRIGGAQLEWLRQDLEANRGARAIFVFSHTEFFSSPFIDEKPGKGHPALQNAGELHELFRRYPVRAVFSGHEHLFWREPAGKHDGIEYFVAGGGGAPLYAPPDRGGFAHYLLVRLEGEQARYDVLEPGRLFTEGGRATRAGERRLWVVNSNDAEIPLRGATASVPAKLGPCPALAAESDLKTRDGQAVPVPVRVSSCNRRGTQRELRLQLVAPPDVSVPILLRRR